MRHVMRRRGGNQIGPGSRHHNQHCRNARRNQPHSPCARKHRIRHQRPIRRNQKTQSIDSGDAGNLQQRQTMRRRIAGKIPRRPDDRDIRPKIFQRSPQKRRDRARQQFAFARSQRHARRKHRADQTANKSNQSHKRSGDPRIDIPVLAHHRIDPRQAHRIKNLPVQKSVQRSFLQRRAGRRQNQHPHRHPGQQIKIVIGKREAESGTTTDGEQHSRVTRQFHLMLNYRLETQLFQGALGGFRGSHIGVGSHLHVIKSVGGRIGHK